VLIDDKITDFGIIMSVQGMGDMYEWWNIKMRIGGFIQTG